MCGIIVLLLLTSYALVRDNKRRSSHPRWALGFARATLNLGDAGDRLALPLASRMNSCGRPGMLYFSMSSIFPLPPLGMFTVLSFLLSNPGLPPHHVKTILIEFHLSRT